MKRLFVFIYSVLSSRALPPLVIGFFLLIYVAIAFVMDEALLLLIRIASSNAALVVLFALIPLNSLLRLFDEIKEYLKRQRIINGKTRSIPPEIFEETIDLDAGADFSEVSKRLVSSGYKIITRENVLAAWRGVSAFPARFLYLAGTFCLFAGILISLTTRTSSREALIEGQQLPYQAGGGDIVERINLEKSSGPFMSKTLLMEVGSGRSGTGSRRFGLYPPSLYSGMFVYPRYLGVNLSFRFSAPDLPNGYETSSMLNIYPPGKETSKEIPGTPYRIVFSMVQPVDGSDPYMTGRMTIQFKMLKGGELLFTNSAPMGGAFTSNGYHLAFPEIRRLVITDFIRDRGVLLVWAAFVLFVTSFCVWLPIRLFSSRKEMCFIGDANGIRACSRAEGGRRRHAGVFHEALDLLESGREEREPVTGNVL